MIFLLCTVFVLSAQESAKTLVVDLKSHETKKVLVVAHRGDWRNAPENSLQAFQNCIAMGVDIGGAGDQGIMFGYACDETENYMPYAIDMAHKLAKQLTKVRKENIIPYLRPDGKTQVTVEYENDKPKRIETILISNQHLENVDMQEMKKDIIEKVIKQVVPEKYIDENNIS